MIIGYLDPEGLDKQRLTPVDSGTTGGYVSYAEGYRFRV